ncbi:helix-turn-helix transcriptional regulator [Pseudomonas sp. S31]|uniref:AraC family transcriptional regulator n=1 Tax=Pseudomonas sp. S31 TaxID=1564473 RepID=UPI001F30DB2B|nr:helix-turn-helix transcriptional regulator [Pseudomonas sp. S31]MBK4999940.1 helix-turn-helix transcriptional regulator [Pseudomonas sp. S31]
MASSNGVAHAVSLLRMHAQAALGVTPDQVEAFDARAASDVLAANYSPNRLAVLSSDGPLAMQWHRRPIGDLQVASLRFGVPVNLDQAPTSFLLVSTQLQGSATIHTPRGVYSGGGGLVMIDSLEDRINKAFSADSWRLHVQFPLAMIESAYVDFHGSAPDKPLRFDAMLQAGGSAQIRWIGFLNLLMTYMIGPEPAPDARTIEFLQQSALFTLMHAIQGDNGNGFAPQPFTPRHVKRAEGFIRGNLRQDIKLAEIANAAGVSVRSLSEGFQRAFQQSPMQYVKGLRLDGVRNELLRSESDRLVSEIAESWGFNHLGRFSEQYRLRFGELPSKTPRG